MLRKAVPILLIILATTTTTTIISYSFPNSPLHYEFSYAQGEEEEEEELSASGSGTIMCADGVKTYDGKIYFLAIKNEGPVYGTYQIIVSNTSNNSLNNEGSFINGNINSTQYDLVGSEISDQICRNDSPSTVTIRGGCGPQSVIDVVTSIGAKARFVGEVSCPTLRDIGSPVAEAAGPVEVAVGEKAILSGAGSVDPDGDPLKYQWEQIGGTVVDLSNPNSVEAEFTAPSVEENTTLTFELTVDDGRGGTDTDSMNVNVNVKNNNVELNEPPTAVADASPKTVTAEGTEVTLDGSRSTDPDDDSLAYKWEQIDGPSVGLSNADEATSTFDTALEIEEDTTLTFELTVDDGRGGSDTDTVNILLKAAGEQQQQQPPSPPPEPPENGENGEQQQQPPPPEPPENGEQQQQPPPSPPPESGG
jgi:hypothetical protein